MNLIEQLHTPYLLKEVERTGKVGTRQESTAEHVYSMLVLAEYFLKKYPTIDKNKVKNIILYHDFPEILVGDVNILDEEKRKDKETKENNAIENLKTLIPKELAKDMCSAWKEFLENKTPEARFCHAIDALDPIIQSIKQKEEWSKHKFTEKKLRKYKEHHLRDFPEMLSFFNELITYLKENKTIPEE